MVFYQQYEPSGLLNDAIECYWFFRAPFASAKGRETLIPGGRIEWIFNFASPLQWLIGEEKIETNAFPGSFIMGQRDRVYFAQQTGATSLLGIRFKPGGFSRFSHIPAHELLNRMLPAGEIFRFPLFDLENKLNGFDYREDEKIKILEKNLFLYKKAPSTHQKQALEMIDALRKCSDISSIEEYCLRNNTYYKKLERVFLQYTGYTPKGYLRILRFNRALRNLDRPLHLTRLALSSGYFDQSHFIKEFHRFAGMPPGSFEPSDHTIPQLLMRHQAV